MQLAARIQGAGPGQLRGPGCQLSRAGGQFGAQRGGDRRRGDDSGPPGAAGRLAGRPGGEVGLQQVPAGCQVTVRRRQIPGGRVCVAGPGFPHSRRGRVQAGSGAAQREPAIRGRPHLGICCAGGGEVIGQDKVIQVAGHGGDEAVELGDDRAPGSNWQVAAGPGGRGDVRARRAQEVTKDGCHGHHGPSAGRYARRPVLPRCRRPGP
jgi:hypothetical protein